MAESSSTGSSNKKDKKARRAAKLQQKEASGGGADPEVKCGMATAKQADSAPSSSTANASSVAVMTDTPPPAAPSSGKKNDKKARRAALVQQKEDGGEQQRPQEVKVEPSSSAAATVEGTNENLDPAVPSSGVEKKILSKAERRELQGAQRKAKLEKKVESTTNKPAEAAEKPKKKPTTSQFKRTRDLKSLSKSTKARSHTVHLLSHLPDYRPLVPLPKGYIHPAIAQIGLQYTKGVIRGANARAVALLCALKQVVEDYATPDQKELARDLHDQVKIYMDYLHTCRPISVSMDSISKYLAPIILSCRNMTDSQSKQYLADELDRFYKERIHSSDNVIVTKTLEKIVDRDVIVTYGHSSLILKVLAAAVKKFPSVSVVIIDSRPKFEGREMLRKLVKACPGISISYLLINAVSYVMPRATKVLLGAHAVLANGYIMSRAGTAQVAAMAKTYNVPLLVCCETYKFSYKMQTDSIVANELGDATQMVNINGRPGPLSELADRTNLHVLNICYDVTPPDYVTGLITETGVIPCTSAPVVIRVKQQFNLVNVKS